MFSRPFTLPKKTFELAAPVHSSHFLLDDFESVAARFHRPKKIYEFVTPFTRPARPFATENPRWERARDERAAQSGRFAVVSDPALHLLRLPLRFLPLKVSTLFIVLFAALRLIAKPVPSDWIQPPLTVVSETVNVNVGEKMALVVGRYWYQYVKRFDDGSTGRVPIYYAAFVPDSMTDYKDLLEATQVKLMLGQREFRPESARLLTDEETGPVPTLPHGFSVAWYTFQIPRELAELRFDVVISHFQPTYLYEGKTVAAYYPWLPNLEPMRQELELLDKNFVITFQALPGVTFDKLTGNERVDTNTPTRLELHPVHQEVIAVSVSSGETEKPKK